MLPTIEWRGDRVVMIDQRLLPEEEVYVECRSHEEVAAAVEAMVIRGAPAIGVAAAMGVALGFGREAKNDGSDEAFRRVTERLGRTRPTARNLFWALERMKAVYDKNRGLSLEEIERLLVTEALAVEAEDIEANRRIGAAGRSLIRHGMSVLTHCNTGGLATAGYGTALGVIRAAFEEGKNVRVVVDETRPFLQGARLTCWELSKLGIPHVLIADGAAGWLMQAGEVGLAMVGADRIARNGDTANKIGTYSLAVLAREHGIPFYVAAPWSTVDLSLDDGRSIPVEERGADEIRRCGGRPIAPAGTPVRNPAFDITPARFLSGIVTEFGIARPPYERTLPALGRP
ncbi:MAG: S-methyl-5-thioribose-1-phosphate isomerase [Candidatus Aminicenantes bacterium]|nr:S-methyl-5-thioribose-1-phosphate isomerase [Candidatus Aminicenantes bacterium]